MSKRSTIVGLVATRLATIRTVNGYQTNIGMEQSVWRPDDFPPTVSHAHDVRDPEETHEQLNGSLGQEHTLTIEVRICVAAGTNGVAVARLAIGDVWKAIGTDRKWSGHALDTLPVSNSLAVRKDAVVASMALVVFRIRYRTANYNPDA